MKLYDMMTPSIDNAEAPDTGERVTDGIGGFEPARWVTATVDRSCPEDIGDRLLRHTEDTRQYGLTLVDCERIEPGGPLVAPLESRESLFWHAAMAGAAQLLPEPVTFWRGLHHGMIPRGAVNPDHYPHTRLCPPSDRVYWRPHWTRPIVPDDPRIKLWFISPTLGGAGSGREFLTLPQMRQLVETLVERAAPGAGLVLWDAPAGRNIEAWRDACRAMATEARDIVNRMVPQDEPDRAVV